MARATSTTTALKQIKNTNSNHKKSSSDNKNEEYILLPGLPNHLAQLCLSPLHPSLLYTVCRSWRRLIYSPSFPAFFSLYALLSPRSPRPSNSIEFFSLDPVSSTWTPLPSPSSPLHLLHRHPSFISRTLPIQSVAVSGRLVLIAATNPHFLPALSHPLVFDPLSTSNRWFSGPPLPTPRRWCATGSVGGAVYVASGMGSCYHSDMARSVEKWEVDKKDKEWIWEEMAALKDGRFSREAVEAVGYRGKLYMVNVKGKTIKQGGVYNVAKNRWEEMPKGMLAGWSGPVAAATILGREEEMFVVDEEKGGVSKYDADHDRWEKVVESLEILKGAEQIAVGRGRVCAVCGGGGRIVVVDVAARPPRTWVVNPPPEMEVVSLHILPRMSLPE
ncbi:F-box/kelch-repeat protein SKIP25-like [Actinidia eriantha]|uniref:F-box/kelch-repeat protein SKIP25-like n=1 Tax=Actinidia eriantha TaxID=165200 RepID=UPI00258BFA01|nr:F-box/kelch-repeat protein SKIP25-like [Actinidia eriantha]